MKQALSYIPFSQLHANDVLFKDSSSEFTVMYLLTDAGSF